MASLLQPVSVIALLVVVGALVGFLIFQAYSNPRPASTPEYAVLTVQPALIRVPFAPFVDIFSPPIPPKPTYHVPRPELSQVIGQTPPLITIQAPICYDLPQAASLCMGRIINETTQTLSDIQLGLYEFDQLLRTFSPEQHALQPSESAPYRYTTRKTYPSEAMLQVRLIHTRTLATAPLRPQITRETGAFYAGLGYGEYALELELYNPHPQALAVVQITLTLEDERGQLAGYRTLRLTQGLQSGESTKMNLVIVPQVVNTTFQHHILLDAWGN